MSTEFATSVHKTPSAQSLAERYKRIRRLSETIAEPLSAEDCAIQSMPDVSPTRWHLAHTTWFFETFLLKDAANYRAFDSSFEFLFNSYYNSVGNQFPRHRRGVLSRPGLAEAMEYRRHVDEAMLKMLEADAIEPRLAEVLELGLNHEQQHQELMLTDIKHVLSCNPLFPAYRESGDRSGNGCQTLSQETPDAENQQDAEWLTVDDQLVEIGHSGHSFCFDNERPRHRTLLHKHALAKRCVTNRDYLEFMDDGGYSRPELWLSMGWQAVCEQTWKAPLYWVHRNGEWLEFTLGGLRPINACTPVCHVSYFEADAFARWAGYRLPTEFEWEYGAADCRPEDLTACNFADLLLNSEALIHPAGTLISNSTQRQATPLQNLLGDVWEWTSSQYTPYPGFEAAEGALGEYNGKFMCNQFVLRGGSCATSSDHIRPTYRNFFPPDARWQFSGIRLAK